MICSKASNLDEQARQVPGFRYARRKLATNLSGAADIPVVT